jgi:hypothetical protein
MSSFLSCVSRWSGCDFHELPSLSGLEAGPQLDCALIAGGLALVLSRCTPCVVERDFPASSLAYRGLRARVRRGRSVELSPQLLSDVCHEVAQHADATTRQALLRCLRRGSATAQVRLASAQAVLPTQKISAIHAVPGRPMGIRAAAR